MLHLNSGTAYFWYNGAADMRKGFDALCGIVQQHFQTSVLQGGVFIFVNRKRNEIKLLSREADGLATNDMRMKKVSNLLWNGGATSPEYTEIQAVSYR